MKYINIQLILFLISIMTMASACNKIVDISPVTEVDANELFSNDQAAASAVVGIYSKMVEAATAFNGNYTRHGALYFGELKKTLLSNQGDNSFYNNNLQPTDAIISEYWNSFYYYIYCSNAILSNLQRSSNISDSAKAKLIGETKFLRALVYFYLVNTFGDVPLVVGIDEEVNKVLPRSSVQDVYKQIISDLTDAQEKVSMSYPFNYVTANNRIRANKAAILLLLARVYLFQKDYAAAESTVSSVINSGLYKLESDLDKVFLATSSETILGLYPTSILFNTFEGRYFGANPAKPAFALTETVLNKFETKDLRFTKWIKAVQTSPTVTYTPYKYKVYDADQPIEYMVLLRYAECFLIRAEARWGQGNKSDAISDVNVIRGRSNASIIPASISNDELRQIIEEENQREYFVELGHRWFQMRRLSALKPTSLITARADEEIPIIKSATWDAYKKNWPIPKNEILKSVALTQNSGYQN